MEIWGAEQVWARIESLARAQPGGVIAIDADGTLWSGDIGEDLFHAFVRHGRVEAPALEALRREARVHDLSDAGSGPEIAQEIYAAYLDGRFPEERMCEIMAWCFAGWTGSEVRRFAQRVALCAHVASRLHPEVLRVLEGARREAIDLVVVSASPVEIVVAGAFYAGFAEGDVVAAKPRFDGPLMLPEVERPIPYGDGKVARLRERVGATRVLYAALGDNAFDVALLASAQVAIAVRPKARLRARAEDVPGLVELASS